MNIIELPASVYVMIGSLSIAFVSCISAYVTTVSNKENKTSEFRQDWANSLRDESSELSSILTELDITFTIMAGDTNGVEKYNGPDVISNPYVNKIISLKSSIRTQSCKVRLRLNPEEIKKDGTLESKIAKDISDLEELASMELGKIKNPEIFKKRRNDIKEKANSLESNLAEIIKENWNKVKSGERAYRLARNVTGWISVTIFAFLLIATPYLIYSTLNKQSDQEKNSTDQIEVTIKTNLR